MFCVGSEDNNDKIVNKMLLLLLPYFIFNMYNVACTYVGTFFLLIHVIDKCIACITPYVGRKRSHDTDLCYSIYWLKYCFQFPINPEIDIKLNTNEPYNSI